VPTGELRAGRVPGKLGVMPTRNDDPPVAMAYSSPLIEGRRPGLATAVGILSIVFGALQVLMAAFIAMMMFGLYMAQVASQAQAKGGLGNYQSGGLVIIADKPPPTSVNPDELINELVAGLSGIGNVPASREPMLRAMVSKWHVLMMPEVRSVPEARGFAFGVSAKGLDEAGNHYFDLPAGRLLIGDQEAIFAPFGSVDVTTLTLKDAQKEQQNLQVMRTPAVQPVFNFRTAGVVMSWINVVASVGLALWLIAAGIFCLAGRRRARRMHLVWAVLKLLIAIVAGVGIWMTFSDIVGAASATSPNPPPPGTAALTGGLMGGAALLVGVLYPIAILIVMNLRQMKDYFAVAPR
jgi:hypothetical protein